MKILKSYEMAYADEKTIKETGINSLVLMENAGRGAFEVIINKYNHMNKFTVVCGSGNNGGDGLVIARYLKKAGKDIQVFILAENKEKLSKDSQKNLSIVKKLNIPYLFITKKNIRKLKNILKDTQVIIDAIFGTGFKPPVKGYREEIIEYINLLEKEVVSIDMPSGLSTDTGVINGKFIKANTTITFAYPKLGHILFPASLYCGEVYIIDISIDEKYTKDINRYILTSQNIQLPKREKDSHKYTYGHNLIIGGSIGKSGAVILSAKASTYAGAGLTTVFVPEDINNIVENNLIEEMSIPTSSTNGTFNKKSIPHLEKVLQNGKFTSITLGMGMSVNEDTKFFVERMIELNIPLVIDADGLNNLSTIENFKKKLKQRKFPTVITPHIGEMSRLTKLSTDYIKQNQEEVASQFAKNTDTIVVLKSARTVVATPKGEVFYNIVGNEAMAKAGTGDVLAGVIGALINRLPVIEAVKTGVYIHSLASDLAIEIIHKESLKASDIIKFIPKAYEYVERKKGENPPYNLITRLFH